MTSVLDCHGVNSTNSNMCSAREHTAVDVDGPGRCLSKAIRTLRLQCGSTPRVREVTLSAVMTFVHWCRG
jgi:hypothetical protein